jgi:hypothetical protein
MFAGFTECVWTASDLPGTGSLERGGSGVARLDEQRRIRGNHRNAPILHVSIMRQKNERFRPTCLANEGVSKIERTGFNGRQNILEIDVRERRTSALRIFQNGPDTRRDVGSYRPECTIVSIRLERPESRITFGPDVLETSPSIHDLRRDQYVDEDAGAASQKALPSRRVEL